MYPSNYTEHGKFQKEEIYWPDTGESRTFCNMQVETDSEETVGNHSVVTMKMTDGDMVSKKFFLYARKPVGNLVLDSLNLTYLKPLSKTIHLAYLYKYVLT